MAKDKEKKMGIEEGLERLDEILTEMEDPDIELSKSFERYEEGIGILKTVNEKIEEMEQKIELLSADGVITEFEEGIE